MFQRRETVPQGQRLRQRTVRLVGSGRALMCVGGACCCCRCRCLWSTPSAAACAALPRTLTATSCGPETSLGAWLCSGGPDAPLQTACMHIASQSCCCSAVKLSHSILPLGRKQTTDCWLLGLTHTRRFAEEGSSCRLECTATILPGRAGAGARSNSSSALLDVKPKYVLCCAVLLPGRCNRFSCSSCQPWLLVFALQHSGAHACCDSGGDCAEVLLGLQLCCGVLSLVVCLCAAACWLAAGRSAGGTRCPAGA
jgi:hypothetical protein